MFCKKNDRKIQVKVEMCKYFQNIGRKGTKWRKIGHDLKKKYHWYIHV